MWSILSFITGLAGPLKALIERISSLEIAKITAKTAVEKAVIEAQIEEVHDKRAVIIAAAGNRLWAAIIAIVQLLIASGPICYLTKIFLWDKVIGAFAGCVGRNVPASCKLYETDPLDPYLWMVIMTIISFYFISTAMRK